MAERSEQRVENDNERSWADLPYGVLSEIYSRVHAGDRVVFRLICKPWNAIHPLITRRFQLLNNDSSKCSSPYFSYQNNKLYHPIHDTHHLMDLLPEDKPGAIINVAKDGWLLVTYRVREIFFYNPITKSTVQLPEFHHADHVRSMCFSSPPTSKGWQVIAAKTNYDDGIFIYSIKDGDEDWSFCEFIPTTLCEAKFRFSHCNAVIHKGLYYFLGEHAQLLVHDPEKYKFYVRKASEAISQDLKAYGGKQYMLESDGKLLGVFLNCDGSLIRTCRWNVLMKKWDQIESLGNMMLFLSPASCVSRKVCLRGTGNKIYFPIFIGDHSLFYSLSTKKYHTFDGGSYGDFNIKRLKYYPESIWVEQN